MPGVWQDVEINPYQSPSSFVDSEDRHWKGGADAVLAARGLLHRRVVVHRPVDATIEYLARGVRDRILLDGKAVVSLVPVFTLYERFDFEIPFSEGTLPATVRVKLGRGTLRIASFEIEINGVVAYSEKNGQQIG